jgi:hypothetical protein
VIQVESVGGRVTFDGQTITIERVSRMARSVVGDRTTTIPIAHVSAVEWKPPKWSGAGHIRFAVAGSQAAAAPTPPNRDPNAVLFSKRDRAAFEKLRDTIQAAISP